MFGITELVEARPLKKNCATKELRSFNTHKFIGRSKKFDIFLLFILYVWMSIPKENIERIQTQIEMIRHESRTLSYRIERMEQQRKSLQDEKRKLKEFLESSNS